MNRLEIIAVSIIAWEAGKRLWALIRIWRRETLVMRKGDTRITFRGDGKESIRQMLLTQGFR